ncbi:MAG: AIPR family protein [Pseudomonadota bacterium]
MASFFRRRNGGRGRRARKERAPEAIVVAQREFAAEIGLDFDRLRDHERGALFERFAAFHILRRFHEQELAPTDLRRLVIGASHDNQLDCVVLMIDGLIVDSVEEIDAALDLADDGVNATLVFIQATRSNRFDREKISAFVNGASSFCAERPDFIENEDLQRKRHLKERLFAAARESEARLSISIFGYFAALGAWRAEDRDENKEGELRRGRRILGDLPWAGDVEFEAVDKSRILDMLATSLPLPRLGDELAIEIEDYEARLPKAGLVALPSIPGVEGGFAGHVPINAYLALLEREDGQGLREGIFNLNVRGYQGDEGVNERIRETLGGPDRAQFLLRNNGVTIVADALETERDQVRLENFQIVNGLQTSTVIYRMRDELRAARDVHVPVKLVGATDWPLRRAIIDATNRQTPITGAALFAASDKALEIERYFNMRLENGGPQLLLERRRGQFTASIEIERISLEDLLRAFYAVFHEAPNVAERGFGAIAGELDAHLFAPSLTAEPYYMAARLLSVVRRVSAERGVPKLDQLEHHAALGLRVVCAPDTPPMGDAVAMRAMCRRIELQLDRPDRFSELADIVTHITQSPRDRIRARKQGIATLKKTRDDVLRRARERILPNPA